MYKNENYKVDGKLHWTIILRKRLLIKGSYKWNAIVRDFTSKLETFFK